MYKCLQTWNISRTDIGSFCSVCAAYFAARRRRPFCHLQQRVQFHSLPYSFVSGSSSSRFKFTLGGLSLAQQKLISIMHHVQKNILGVESYKGNIYIYVFHKLLTLAQEGSVLIVLPFLFVNCKYF